MVEVKDVGVIVTGGGTVSIGNVITVAGTIDVTGTLELNSSGGLGTIPNAAVNVDSVGGLIADANPTRLYLGLSNLGGTTVYLSFGSPATLDSGIILPVVQSFEIDQTRLFKGSIYGITPTGTVSVGKASW